MLTHDQVSRMTDAELSAARRAISERLDQNYSRRRAASGCSSRFVRGGTKIRTRRVRATDWTAIRRLEIEASDIYYERGLLDAEIARRAHEEART